MQNPVHCLQSVNCRRQVDAWRKARKFAVLLAENAATHQMAGAATVFLKAAEAVLPPPFPTLAKPRCLSELARQLLVVSRGEAVFRCCRLTSRWSCCRRAAEARRGALTFNTVCRMLCLKPETGTEPSQGFRGDALHTERFPSDLCVLYSNDLHRMRGPYALCPYEICDAGFPAGLMRVVPSCP